MDWSGSPTTITLRCSSVEQPHELPLRGVRVLELVDEDVPEALPPPREHVGMLAEQAHRQQQQVVEVGGRRVEQPPLVLAVDLRDAPVGGTGGPVESLLGGHELVLERRDLRRQPAGGEPLRVEVQVPAHVVDEPDRIGLVVDRERRADPELSASRRRMRAHAEWNVDTHMRWATGPTSPPTRSFISPAALLVNVIASSWNGESVLLPDSYATRLVSTRVLPEPAPATTSSGTSGGAVTASAAPG